PSRSPIRSVGAHLPSLQGDDRRAFYVDRAGTVLIDRAGAICCHSWTIRIRTASVEYQVRREFHQNAYKVVLNRRLHTSHYLGHACRMDVLQVNSSTDAIRDCQVLQHERYGDAIHIDPIPRRCTYRPRTDHPGAVNKRGALAAGSTARRGEIRVSINLDRRNGIDVSR